MSGTIVNGYTLDGGNLTVGVGTTYNNLFVSPGFDNIVDYGTINNLTINAQQLPVDFYVESGGILNGGSIQNLPSEDADNFIYVYGTETNLTLGVDAYVRIESGGKDSADIVASGGLLELDGGSANGITVQNGGNILDNSGIISFSTFNTGGGIRLTGTASNNLIKAGGEEDVSDGGIDINSTIQGLVYVVDYGSLAGTLSGDTIINEGTTEIRSGATAFSTTINSGGIETIDYGGRSYSASVESGGFEILTGGTSTDGIIQTGGTQDIAAFLYNSSGVTSTYIGESISAVLSGGTETISSGGIATGTVIYSGGAQTILSGGTASGTTILHAGTETISAGGVAIGTDIFSGGAQTILAGGSAAGTQMYRGTETISSGGIARGTVIYAGGQVIVSSGGLLVNSPIGSNGEVTVKSGGVVSAAKIAGGTLDLAGGKAVGPITFSNTGGELLAMTALPASIISGFAAGDEIVLRSITYKAGATVTVKSAGVVTIADNNKAYNLKIAGAVVGETDFKFSSGSVLTKVASPAMEFLRPAANPDAPMMDAVMVGAGREMFGVYDVPAVLHGGYMAHEGWRPVFYGVPMSLGLHPQ